MTLLTNLVDMIKKQGKTEIKEQNSSTNFQLSYFNDPETPIKLGFLTSGTIEWE